MKSTSISISKNHCDASLCRYFLHPMLAPGIDVNILGFTPNQEDLCYSTVNAKRMTKVVLLHEHSVIRVHASFIVILHVICLLQFMCFLALSPHLGLIPQMSETGLS